MSETMRRSPAEEAVAFNADPKIEITAPARPVLLRHRDIRERAESGEGFEGVDLQTMMLAEFNLPGRSFRDADVRGVRFYSRSMRDQRANISVTDWREAIFADSEMWTDFRRVEASGARFGYDETLEHRRQRHEQRRKEMLMEMSSADSGSLINFHGEEGIFDSTSWRNVDFGGSFPGYEARFANASFREAFFAGCDLTNIDFTSCDITGIQIHDVDSMEGMMIRADQVRAVADALYFTDSQQQADFEAMRKEIGDDQRMLEERFRVAVKG